MPLPPAIGLADIIRAFTVLKPETDEAKRAIAQSLGFEYHAPEPETVEADDKVGVKSPHG